jgi:hypothetical protein
MHKQTQVEGLVDRGVCLMKWAGGGSHRWWWWARTPSSWWRERQWILCSDPTDCSTKVMPRSMQLWCPPLYPISCQTFPYIECTCYLIIDPAHKSSCQQRKLNQKRLTDFLVAKTHASQSSIAVHLRLKGSSDADFKTALPRPRGSGSKLRSQMPQLRCKPRSWQHSV